jgi:3-dehydroquinate synthase
MIEIPVDLGERGYPIVIAENATRLIPERLARYRGRPVVLVSDRRVYHMHGAHVERALKSLGRVARIIMPAGERYKTRATLDRIHDELVRIGTGRDTVIVALGGGVVGDVAGFAAATYMRGLDWIGLPTTLLSMVDSSIGGKVGINHPRAKNLIGAFHQPRAVLIDISFLDTLPHRERRSGAYEMLKCGVIGDPELFASLQKAPPELLDWDHASLQKAVAASCRIKADVVKRDEREGGLRRVLNLGHTIGHALEAATAYRRFTHGEAVGWGMVGAAWLSQRKDLLRPDAYEAILDAVDRLGPRPRFSDLSADRILAALRHDKKAKAGRVPFVLPTRIGEVVVRSDVDGPEVRLALKAMALREDKKRPAARGGGAECLAGHHADPQPPLGGGVFTLR